MGPAEMLERFHRLQGQAYLGGDLDQLAPLLTEDITWHVPGTSAIAGDHAGVDETLAYFRRRREFAHNSMRISAHGQLESGDTVAVLAGGAIDTPKGAARWETVGVYRFADQRLAEVWLVPLDGAYFDELWLALAERRDPPPPSDAPVPLPGAEVSRTGGMTTELLELGSVVVARHRVRAGFDSTPLYRELPGGVCPCEHLCRLEQGALTYRFSDGSSQALPTGEAAHVSGGHLADVHADASLIELTALDEYRRKQRAQVKVG